MQRAAFARLSSWLMLATVITMLPDVALAQQPPAPPPPPGPPPAPAAPPQGNRDSRPIIVEGASQRGAVEGGFKPEQTLSQDEIMALGVSNISELIDRISQQIGGSPVYLLNGKRISGPFEMATIPSEAIARTEILPAEAGIAYGFEGDQKVVNIVLVPFFNAATAQAGYLVATRGGRETPSGELSMQTIANSNRFNIAGTIQRSGMLLESERDVTPVSGTADQAEFRSLQPRTRQYNGSISLTRALGSRITGTLTGAVTRSHNLSLQGLSGATLILPVGNPFSTAAVPTSLFRYFDEAAPLSQRSKNTNVTLGANASGVIGVTWRWNFIGNYARIESDTRTNRGIDPQALQAALNAGDPAVNPLGTIPPGLLTPRPFDTGNNQSSTMTGNVLVNGPLFKLPAGMARLSSTLAYNGSDQTSRSVRAGVASLTDYSNDSVRGQLSLNLPLTSRVGSRFGGGIGNLSANVAYGFQHSRGFGTHASSTFGLNWIPITQIFLIASVNSNKTPPQASQLDAPLIATPNVSVFDYRTGNTVFVTSLSGGNPGLRASSRQTASINAQIRPFTRRPWSFTANYSRTRTTDQVQALPQQSPAIEAAFPERFLRDGNGNLISIDRRPTNFTRAVQSTLRLGVNMTFNIGKAPPPPPMRAPPGRGAIPPLPGRGAVPPVPGRAATPPPPGASPAPSPAPGRGAPTLPAPPAGAAGAAGLPAEIAQQAALLQAINAAGSGGGPIVLPAGALPPGVAPPPGFIIAGAARPQLRIDITDTWLLSDKVLIRPGLPVIDNLRGGATNGRGQPRHRVQANASLTHKGFGLTLETLWTAPTRTTGSLAGSSTLRFGAQTNLNLRLFSNFAAMPKLVKKVPMLKGSRINLDVVNLLDFRQRVTDAAGRTPIQYEPDRLNPLGRTIQLRFRKQF